MDKLLAECMLDILTFIDKNKSDHEIEITNNVLDGDYPSETVSVAMRSLLHFKYLFGHVYSGNNTTMYFASGLTDQGHKFLEEYGR